MVFLTYLGDILSWLDQLDRHWLAMIHQGLAGPILDTVMRAISSKVLWFSVVGIWLGVAFITKRYRVIAQILVVAAVLGVADFLAAQWLKPTIGRLRPCQSLDFIREVSGCAGRFGFPSNHATNAMVVATMMLGLRPWRRAWYFLVIALLVGFSRVYLGVHYPFDVLMGFVFGAGVSGLILLLARPWLPGERRCYHRR